MAEEKLTAATRLEKILDNIAGGDNEITPATRLEKFLSYIADAMEGGGGGCDCEVPTMLLNIDNEYNYTASLNSIFVYSDEDETFLPLSDILYNVTDDQYYVYTNNTITSEPCIYTVYINTDNYLFRNTVLTGAEVVKTTQHDVPIGSSNGIYLKGDGFVLVDITSNSIYTTLTDSEITHIGGVS